MARVHRALHQKSMGLTAPRCVLPIVPAAMLGLGGRGIVQRVPVVCTVRHAAVNVRKIATYAMINRSVQVSVACVWRDFMGWSAKVHARHRV